MSPMTTMIISGLACALFAVGSLWSGAVWKRAFDAHHQASVALRSRSLSPAPSVKVRSESRGATKDVMIDQVKSVDQKGGVTAGYVETINQGPPSN
jgi:ribosome modulation factor